MVAHSLATAEGAQAQLNESGMQNLVLEFLGPSVSFYSTRN